MANPLTGDFQAVLQVSGGTINRLLATLHQNAFANAKLPSFPHSVRMRIGDDHAIDRVRGRVDCQISVPRVELIHGVTDRFLLEVGVRAWYRPDPGTGPLPAFIHGTVRATYHFQDIDPSCPGWAQHASDHLWIRVIKDSVRFVGTADDDHSPLDSAVGILSADPAAADAANIARITRQVAGLLATRFEATPHPVSKRFRRGSMRSLSAPIGGSAIAAPIALDGGEPVGDIASINNLLLDGADFAVGVSLDYIMSVITPALDAIKTFNKTVAIHVSTPWYMPDINTVYRASVDPPSIAWLPKGGHAVIKVKVHGRATTNSVLANATFDIEQDITLGFDPAGPNFTLTHGSPGVSVHAGGLYHGTVRGAVRDSILASVPPIVQAACAKAQPTLDAMTTRTQELSQQLATLDDKATVGLDDALFLRDGMVLRGTISLARRPAPVVKFDKTAAGDGFNALQSWIPGGRIDTFEWSWTWSGSGESGKASRSDRFLLRRPAGKVGRWGTMLGLAVPLPGLDGNGSVCLRIKGVRVDPVTGNLVPVESSARCTRFGLNLAGIHGAGHLYLRDMPELSKPVPFPQLALIGTKPASRAAGAANTLVLYVDEAWDRETATTLEGGLAACRRYDAGLSLLLLFREGVLEAGGTRLLGEVEAFARTLGISAVVNEDVGGSWSRALGLQAGTGQPGWGLISPEGNPLWTQQGRIEAAGLALALDGHLRRCPDPVPMAFGLKVGLGERVVSNAFNPGWLEPTESHCPPLPLGARGELGAGAVVAFVQKKSAASVAELRRIAVRHAQPQDRRRDQPVPLVVAVVHGADPREVEALKAEVGLDFVALSDATGTITQRFGVEVWPTTMTLDGSGTISAIEAGVSAHREDAGS